MITIHKIVMPGEKNLCSGNQDGHNVGWCYECQSLHRIVTCKDCLNIKEEKKNG